jgi:hypothetical protein
MNMRAVLSNPVVVAATVVAIFSSGSWGTSPPTPPYHQYSVWGVLERIGGGSRENFTVVLLAKSRHHADSTFRMLNGIPNTRFSDRPVSLTDSTGAFFVRVSSHEAVDSLQVAVVIPGLPLIAGTPFAIDASQGVPSREWYTPPAEPGCSGCGTNPAPIERVVFYAYHMKDALIVIVYQGDLP